MTVSDTIDTITPQNVLDLWDTNTTTVSATIDTGPVRALVSRHKCTGPSVQPLTQCEQIRHAGVRVEGDSNDAHIFLRRVAQAIEAGKLKGFLT